MPESNPKVSTDVSMGNGADGVLRRVDPECETVTCTYSAGGLTGVNVNMPDPVPDAGPESVTVEVPLVAVT